ncbi:MAG: monovalent cation/H(+) antiporter subunit G [Deinococcota bacterium]|jgi:multicomponent Na+:H+ antiporter subunit G|nr:monovalent cation/H(+) antiporter subunit G [Deinococcota bacterium]
MSEVVTAVLMLSGGVFLLIAALGILRMPDLMLRMHAATKAGTLGAGLIVFSVATYYLELSIAARALVAVSFIFLTAPVAAHVIGRAAYIVGVHLWQNTVIDELQGHYDARTHRLRSDEQRAKEAAKRQRKRAP